MKIDTVATPPPFSPFIAVVITTYNNPRSLELCLTTLTQQTFKNFEVFIADDGSKEETRTFILDFKKRANFMIYHFWQPDEGYQKAKINNTVFRQIDEKRYPIILCIDHDVILHPRFVEDHFLAHQRFKFAPLMFMGRRVDLDAQITESLTSENVLQFVRGLNFVLVLAAFSGRIRNVLRSIRLDVPDWLAHLLKRDRVYDLLGSNYSITTSVLRAVNGYNEDFKSYWGEDGDLFVRVRNSGVRLKGRIGFAVQWHLYHKRLQETREHVEQYQFLLANQEYKFCKNGIVKS